MANACLKPLASPVSTPRMKLPVSCTNVASVVCWNATAINDYSKDHEADTGDDLDHTEDEFDLFEN